MWSSGLEPWLFLTVGPQANCSVSLSLSVLTEIGIRRSPPCGKGRGLGETCAWGRRSWSISFLLNPHRPPIRYLVKEVQTVRGSVKLPVFSFFPDSVIRKEGMQGRKGGRIVLG